MRNLTAILAGLLASAVIALASPASPVPYRYTQPDGSVIILQNHGDEFFSWITCNGVEVEKGADGFFRPVANASARRQARRLEAQAFRERAARLQKEARAEGISMGNKRFLVLLIDFPDRKFTTENANSVFSRMLNETGYSDDGATGSVKQYYSENSGGQFVPTFDVYGPVTVSRSYSYYGEDVNSDHSAHATDALYEACVALDSEIDFSLYDNDKDGYVDVTFFFFAGHSQAEGADAASIWPHQYSMYSHNLVQDGVRIFRYGCSSEYKGASGTNRAGIGTFCHEFGHCLGLPDFYDTDGDTNGRANDLSRFSLMCNGNYLNDGRTPPYLTSVERQMLGWMGAGEPITASGNFTLGPIRSNTTPCITPADVDGEYFLYEMRDGTGWDAYLPKGLVIYHVDQSQNYVSGSITAKSAWNSHKVNCYGSHPCYYIKFSSAYSTTALETMVYPGKENVTSFVPLAWSGNILPYRLSDISVGGSQATFRVERFSDERQIVGMVTGTDGVGIADVTLTLEAYSSPTSASEVRTNYIRPRSAAYTTRSAEDGAFILKLPADESEKVFRVSASKDDFVTREAILEVDRMAEQNFVLRKLVDAPSADLRKYPDGGSANGVGYANKKPQDIMGAVHFGISELRQWGGMYLQAVTFQYAEASPYSAKAYVIVDQGGERVLTSLVPDAQPYENITVDVSGAKIRIEPGKDLYIGYALEGVNANYPLLKKNVSGLADGFFLSSFSTTRSSWGARVGEAILVSATLMDLDAQSSITLPLLGYSYIANPGGYKAGDTFTFTLEQSAKETPASVAWFYDGAATEAASVTLTSGHHRVRAVLTYPGGDSETLVLEIDVP